MSNDRGDPNEMADAAKAYDVIIAGGGVAGVLAAARLAVARPDLKIALLEREVSLGGRLRAAASGERSFGYGLNGISDALFEFWAQTLKQDPDGPDLATLVPRRQQRAGVLAGNRVTQIEIDQWFTAKGARTLGGFAASRQWTEVEAILGGTMPVAEPETKAPAKKTRAGASKAAEATAATAAEDDAAPAEDDEPQSERALFPFAHFWKTGRRTPAAVVLEHFSSAYGIPDVWSASPDALAERAAFHSGHLHADVWDDALQALLDLPSVKAAVTVHTSSRIVKAERDGALWAIQAEGGSFQSRALVVAQPPWQASTWLARALWPPHVLQIALKTKPVSAVILSEKILEQSIELPDVVVVPAEKVQIVRMSASELCFQATIDFEVTIQAPAVTKAVKALKRARKKLLMLHPGLCTEDSRIALEAVAWAQSPVQADRRYYAKLEKKAFQSSALAFVGDAYGASYDGDRNVLSSLNGATEALSGQRPLAAVASDPAAELPPDAPLNSEAPLSPA